MLTAKGETTDKISGLEMGADDYIVKPLEMKEVIARVHAVMRRYAPETVSSKRLVFDGLIIDMEAYDLTVAGKKVDTPPKEDVYKRQSTSSSRLQKDKRARGGV